MPFHRTDRSMWRAAFLAWCAAAVNASAVLFYGTDSATHNTTAPGGLYSGSGWQYQGHYGSYLGTMIAPQYFITAQHFGTQGGSFVHAGVFNGAADVTYTIDTAANGGAGYWDIAGTDLRIFKVNEVFPYYAPLYTGNAETGLTLVTMGRGGARGAEVFVSGLLHGWEHTAGDGTTRWGANIVSGVVDYFGASLLTVEFNRLGLDEEATLSVGDSGGGVFVNDGGIWKLAGVNFTIDGDFDTNNTLGDNSHFSASLFDAGGLYNGSDGGGWTFVNDVPRDLPTQFYASRISSSTAAIQSIIAVPEPAGLLLAGAASILFARRRREKI